MKTFYVVGVRDAKQSIGVGQWVDEKGKLWIDPIAIYENAEEALKAGQENRQECILEVTAGAGEAYLNYAENLDDQFTILDAFNLGYTSGVTELYLPFEIEGKQVSVFTVTDTPIEGVKSLPCSYRFIYTNGAEGRFTYYLNLLIAKTQKAGRIYPYDGKDTFTVKVGKWAFSPDSVGYEVPAIRCHYGNDDDVLYSFAFEANGRRWYCFRGLPQEVDDQLGSTFKKAGRSESHLLQKVLNYWAKLGGSGYVDVNASPYAVIAVKTSYGWLNLLP